MYGTLLLLHILAATIWTGGHTVLATVVLPRVIQERSPARLLEFEQKYEKIGMPALLVQVASGLFLAYRLVPDVYSWFDLSRPLSRVIMAKLLLLALTVGFAIHARLRVVPNLSEGSLVLMAWHIVPVTLFSILFVVAGVSFRTGWLY